MKSRYRVFLCGMCLVGCASGQNGSVANESLERMMSGPVARAAARDAPEAYAEAARAAQRARGLHGAARTEAETEVSLLLEWAQATGRAVAARRRHDEAETETTRVETEAETIETRLAEVNRLTEAREAARETEQRVQRAVESPAEVDEAARAVRAEEVRQSAMLLIAAARMLGADDTALASATQAMTAAEGERQSPTERLASAGRAYTAAETALRTFRASRPVARNATQGAALTDALSHSGSFDAHRDERGVVLVLRGLFTGTALSPASRARIETLARVLQTHGDARVRVESFVGGAPRTQSEARARAQAASLAQALSRAGISRERIESAGVFRLAGGARTEDRTEVVLVLPTEP